MRLCVMLPIRALLVEKFLQEPYSVYPALQCCFRFLSVAQGHRRATMVVYVLVCLGQAQCVCGRGVVEDAVDGKASDDLVLCRSAFTSQLKALGKEGFCLQNASGHKTVGPSVSRGSLLFFLPSISGLPAPNITEANSNISLCVLSYGTTPFCFP